MDHDPVASNAPPLTLTPHVALPVPGSVVATVMKMGPKYLENVRGSPSGSLAVIVWSAVEPSATVISAIGFRTGARQSLVTVMENDWSLLRKPSLARAVAVKVPASVNPGAKWMFPEE